jgi:hypothetical protein
MPLAAAPDSLDQALNALAQQHAALIAGDLARLQQAADALTGAMADLRARRASQPDSATRERLAAGARQLKVNAELVQRAAAGNQRALNTLFEPSTTYGNTGGSGLARPSRVLRSA